MKKKREKVFRVAKCFLENENITIAEVSEKTGISRSSVQRYLNSNLIQEFLELREISEDPVALIKEKYNEWNNIKTGQCQGWKNLCRKTRPFKKRRRKICWFNKKVKN